MPRSTECLQKPVSGKYILFVQSTDRYKLTKDEIVLLGGSRHKVAAVAVSSIGGSSWPWRTIGQIGLVRERFFTQRL